MITAMPVSWPFESNAIQSLEHLVVRIQTTIVHHAHLAGQSRDDGVSDTRLAQERITHGVGAVGAVNSLGDKTRLHKARPSPPHRSSPHLCTRHRGTVA